MQKNWDAGDAELPDNLLRRNAFSPGVTLAARQQTSENSDRIDKVMGCMRLKRFPLFSTLLCFGQFSGRPAYLFSEPNLQNLFSQASIVKGVKFKIFGEI